MTNKIITTGIFLLLSTICMLAQDINGKWTGRVMDQFDVIYVFKAEGEILTGTTKDPEGTDILIKNGKITGNDLEFILPLMGQDNKVTGKMEGDTLTLTVNMMGNDVALVLKKVKE